MKPIVFISSVSDGYQHMRQAAREAIQKAGGQPIGFEDFPALNKTSRNACLDGVNDCDIYVGIFGAKYGWITPSGLSATEEEFKEAVRTGKRRLIFIEEVEDREPEQQAFINRAGDYQAGRFWKKFKTPEDFKRGLEQTLKEVFKSLMSGLSEIEIKERLQQETLEPLRNDYSESWLITGAMPDCLALLADDLSFNDEKLAKGIFLIGQEGDPPVFEIEAAKTKTLRENHWLLEQLEKQGWRDGLQLSFVRLYLDACVVIGMNITGREPESDRFNSQGFYIYPDTVQAITDIQLLFLSRLYDKFDPHLRWDRIALISALHNIKYRSFAKPKPGQTSHSISMGSSEKPVLAFDRPKILERQQLSQPSYSQGLRAAFERKFKER